jgi:hypothetical protein
VTVTGFVGTGLELFSFDTPVMSDVLRNAPPSGDGSVTVTGLGFGLFEYTATATFGTAACSTTSWSSGTSVVCQASDYYDYPGYVEVTVGAMTGTGASVHTYDPGRAGVFSFDAPVGSGVMLNAPNTGDGSVTVTGLNFGSSVYTATAAMGSAPCQTSAWTSGTSVICKMNPQVAEAETVDLTVGGVVGTGYQVFTFDAPVGSTVSASATWGFILQITDVPDVHADVWQGADPIAAVAVYTLLPKFSPVTVTDPSPVFGAFSITPDPTGASNENTPARPGSYVCTDAPVPVIAPTVTSTYPG